MAPKSIATAKKFDDISLHFFRTLPRPSIRRRPSFYKIGHLFRLCWRDIEGIIGVLLINQLFHAWYIQHGKPCAISHAETGDTLPTTTFICEFYSHGLVLNLSRCSAILWCWSVLRNGNDMLQYFFPSRCVIAKPAAIVIVKEISINWVRQWLGDIARNRHCLNTVVVVAEVG
ncbi:hypothetical protein EDWATA_02931 [Edwardsiella tarda ATCC 23685]|uniref:Uncharacterized protein n=1 Tax=Edwardsiella tarda ATCC 23685 TaxID=500638 RepID=D4F844_EDWTA|nr:hypothetical protein EDWATA_02931 [Edwardsiella tarda ATCC 23685]